MKPSIITIHLFFLFVGLFLGLALQAQPITNGGFTNATSGTLYDTGDSGGDYGPNENIVYTICPSNSNCVQLDFFSFSTELNSDILNIYDGPNTASPLIGSYSGDINITFGINGIITAASGCVTLEFISNGSTQSSGFIAVWNGWGSTCITGSTLGPNNDCMNAYLVCDDTPLNYNSNGAGDIDDINFSNSGCLSAIPGENQSAWYRFQLNNNIPANSSITFTITPANPTSDYDFAIYGPNPDCGNLGQPVRCSAATYDKSPNGTTGLKATESDTSEPSSGGNGFVDELIVNPGEVYYILVNNFTVDNLGFDLTWGGVATTGGLNCVFCSLAVDAGPDASLCQGETASLSAFASKGTSFYQYNWEVVGNLPGFSFSNPNATVTDLTPPPGFIGTVDIKVTVEDINQSDVNNEKCEISDVLTLTFLVGPVASDMFIPDSQVCIDELTYFEYQGLSPPGSTFNWNFGGGTPTPNSNNTEGPYEISWATAGTKTVTFTVDDGNCQSTASFNIVVQAPLANIADLICANYLSDGITFDWSAIPNAEIYQVTVYLNGVYQYTDGSNTQTQYTVTGALPGDEIAIEVIALDSNGVYCGSEPAFISCVVPSCPNTNPPGLQFTNLVNPYCTSDPDFQVQVAAGFGGGVFAGPNISPSGWFEPDKFVSAGIYTLTYTYTDANGCDFTITYSPQIYLPPVASFSLSSTQVCTGEAVTLNYNGAPLGAGAAYNWNFGGAIANPNSGTGPILLTFPAAGNYTITLSTESQGCPSLPVSQTITVLQAPTKPIVDCVNITDNSIDYDWNDVPGATEYELDIIINGIPQAPQTTTNSNYTVSGLSPNTNVTIIVTAKATPPCSDAQSNAVTCKTSGCTPIAVSISGLNASYCTGAGTIVNLSGNPAGGVFSKTGSGLSGNTLDIDAAGAGTHTITYTVTDILTGCVDQTTVVTTIYDPPTVSLSVNPNTVCVGNNSAITYTGNALPGDTYAWNFGANAAPATANTIGPHNVQWSTAGNKTINLTVTANGCSASGSNSVNVETPLPTPIVTCTSTTNSVSFNWGAIAGATDYDLSITITDDLGNPLGTTNITQPGTTYTENGLQPGYTVTISVIANGNGACGDSPAGTATCIANDCPTVDLQITSFASTNFCTGDPAVTLTANEPGATFTVNGKPDTTFDPSSLPAGTYTIEATLNNPPCIYTASVTATIYLTPVANFIMDANPLCNTNPATFTFTGTADAAANYTWDFGVGATPATATTVGPHLINYSTVGSKTITLVVNNNGCIDSQTSNLAVDEPIGTTLISCNSTTTNVDFNWSAVPGASGYDITITIKDDLGNIVSGPTTLNNQPGTNYSEGGLQPNYSVEIIVVPLGGGACGNGPAATATCFANDCPTVDLQITNFADTQFCVGDAAITLTANEPAATFTINGSPATIFDPNALGAGIYTIEATYINGPCTYTDTETATVYSLPVAAMTATPNPVCVNIATTISFTGSAGGSASYNWSFGADASIATANTAGPHSISYATAGSKTINLTVTENGCTDSESINLTVEAPLATPVVACNGQTTTTVDFGWGAVAGAASYDVTVTITDDLGNVISGPTTKNQAGTTYNETGLQPGYTVTISVVAIGTGACGNSASASANCVASDCAAVDLQINCFAKTNYCTGEAIITLSATEPTATFTVNGVSAVNFNPASLGAGSHTIVATYTNGPCSYTDTEIITIAATPVADINLSVTSICVNESIEAFSTGSNGPTASFNWQFDAGANPLNANTVGPHTVTYNTAGNKNITLVVTENGCVSNTASETLTVIDQLATPNPDCTYANENSVVFGWDPVPGANDYQVTIIVNGSDTTVDVTTNTTYPVDNLKLGDNITIIVVAQSAILCASELGQADCQTVPCTPLNFDLSAITSTKLCEDALPINFAALPAGGSWAASGNGLTGNSFDPKQAGVGLHSITYTYTDAATKCLYDTTFTITVNALPTATITLPKLGCVDAEATILIETPAPNATYVWDFDGGQIISGAGAGPYVVSWSAQGSKTITVTATENGCTGLPVTQTIDIEALELLLEPSFTITKGDSVMLPLTANLPLDGSIVWAPATTLSCNNCDSPYAKPLQSTIYTVSATTANGCKDDAETTVTVSITPNIIVPNAFSPNNDGVNDNFGVIADGAQSITLTIADRWGNIVFNETAADPRWAGQAKNGNPALVGVYVYYVTATFVNGDQTQLKTGKGNVTLLR